METERDRQLQEPLFDALGSAPALPLQVRPPEARSTCSQWYGAGPVTVTGSAVACPGRPAEPLQGYHVALCYGGLAESDIGPCHTITLMHREHPERNLTVYADPAGQGVARRWLHACELFGLPGIECGHPVAHQQDEWQTADAPRHCRKEIEATVRTGKGAAVSEELRVRGAAVFSTPLSSTVSDVPREKLFAVATVAALATAVSLLLLSFLLAIAAGAGDINRWMLIGGAFLGVLAAAAGSIRFLNWKMTGQQVLELVGEGVGLKCELKGRQISQWSCHHRAVRSVGAWRTGAGGWGVFIRTAEDRVVFGGRLPEGDARRVCRALRERLPL